jgi:hypothetical protein
MYYLYIDNKPTGQVPTGQLPTGQLPTGQVPTGQLPTGQVPTGQVPTILLWDIFTMRYICYGISLNLNYNLCTI